MFEAECRSCGGWVLLSSRRVRSMHNTSHGIVVSFRCWCGQPGVFVTGRTAGETSPGAPLSSELVAATAPMR